MKKAAKAAKKVAKEVIAQAPPLKKLFLERGEDVVTEKL